MEKLSLEEENYGSARYLIVRKIKYLIDFKGTINSSYVSMVRILSSPDLSVVTAGDQTNSVLNEAREPQIPSVSGWRAVYSIKNQAKYIVAPGTKSESSSYECRKLIGLKLHTYSLFCYILLPIAEVQKYNRIFLV